MVKNIIFIIILIISFLGYSQKSSPDPVLTLDGQVWGTDSVMCFVYFFDQSTENWVYVETYLFGDEYYFEFHKKQSLYNLSFFDLYGEKERSILLYVDNTGKHRIDLNYDDAPLREMLVVNKKNTYDEYITAHLK